MSNRFIYKISKGVKAHIRPFYSRLLRLFFITSRFFFYFLQQKIKWFIKGYSF